MLFRNIALASATALVGMTALAQAMDISDLAARAGFLIGTARHCGVPAERADQIREWMATKLVATAAEARPVVYRFDSFINAARFASEEGGLSIRCRSITDAFARLERHVDAYAPPVPVKPAKISARRLH